MSSPVSTSITSQLAVSPAQSVRKEPPQDVVNARQTGLQSDNRQGDTVTLSSRQQADNTAVIRKKPSQPVSLDEKKSLLGTKKSEHSFSVYG